MYRVAAAVVAMAFCSTASSQELNVAHIDQRIVDWQPTRAERRFDDIGWAPDLCTALKAGKAHQRPVFVFTHDGRMQFGRC
jgi:hypothetical protein